jgi:hypothetical protein
MAAVLVSDSTMATRSRVKHSFLCLLCFRCMAPCLAAADLPVCACWLLLLCSCVAFLVIRSYISRRPAALVHHQPHSLTAVGSVGSFALCRSDMPCGAAWGMKQYCLHACETRNGPNAAARCAAAPISMRQAANSKGSG